MKYCLSANQDKEYLKKADEIKVAWKSHAFIIDLIEINPEATIILTINTKLEDDDWDLVKQYYIMTKRNFKVELSPSSPGRAYCLKNKIPFFFDVPALTGWEANAFISQGVSDLYISGILAHQLDYVSTFSVNVRVVANAANAPFNCEPLLGSWFRPEDLSNIEAINICEFKFTNRRQEQALYRIYAEHKEWPGELYLLIEDIPNTKILNRMIPPEFQKRRSNCAMRCQSGGHCHYCYNCTQLAQQESLKKIIKKDNTND